MWRKLDGSSSQTSGAKKCVIPGLGGMGKSRLGRAYVHEALAYGVYDAILWFQLNREVDVTQNRSSLETQYRDWFADEGESINENTKQKSLFNLFKNKVTQRYKHPLIIYDDVPSGDFLRGLLPQTNTHILITSRDALGWEDDEMIPQLEEFQLEESIKFLQQKSGKKVEAEKGDALKVANVLGHLPLALEQAASWVRVKKKPFAKYLEEFTTKAEELMKYKAQGSDYPYAVATTWAVTMNSVSELARKLMRYFAYLRSNDIPLSLFEKLDPEDAIDELVEYSMIKRNDDQISVHQLVQLVNRSDDDKEKTIQELLESWASYWKTRATAKIELHKKEVLYEEYKLCTNWQEHCKAVRSNLTKLDIIDEKNKPFSSFLSSVVNNQLLTRIAELKIYLSILEQNIASHVRVCFNNFFSFTRVTVQKVLGNGEILPHEDEVVKEEFIRELQKKQFPDTLSDPDIKGRVFGILKRVSTEGADSFKKFIESLTKIKSDDLNNFFIENPDIINLFKGSNVLLNVIHSWCSAPIKKRKDEREFIKEINDILRNEYQRSELGKNQEKIFFIGNLWQVTFEVLPHLEVDEKRELFYQFKTLVEGSGINSFDCHLSLRILKKIKRNEREEIIKLIKPQIFLFFYQPENLYLPTCFNLTLFEALIDKLIELSIIERKQFMENFIKCITPELSYSQNNMLFSILSQKGDEEAQIAKEIFLKMMDEEEKQENSLSHTLPINLWKDLNLEHMSEDDEIDLKKAIKKISSDEEKKEIISIVGQLKTLNMDAFDCAGLLSVISEVRSDQRRFIVEEIDPFKQEGMTSEDFAVIIESLFQVQEPLKRQGVTQSVLEITAGKEMAADEIAVIIDTLSKIETHKWPFIIKYIKSIVFTGIHDQECTNIINEFSHTSEEEIELLLEEVQSLTSLIKPHRHSFSHLFHNIRILKVEEREDIISLLFEIFKDGEVDIYEITRTIDELKYLKKEQRHKVVFIVKEMRERLSPNTPLFMLMHSLPVDDLVKLIMKEV